MTAPDLAKGRRFLAAQGAPLSLVVGVTGAHYYGFPSPDSDLDLKGIHVEPTARVVSLAPAADTIDHTGWFEQLEIDYTSHELGFALRLLLKGNGNILERILTPFQLLSSGEASELQQLAAGGVCRRFDEPLEEDFQRLEALLSESHAASDLPETAANVDAMDAFLVRMRRRNFE